MSTAVENGAGPSSRTALRGEKKAKVRGAGTEGDDTKPLLSIRPRVIEYYNSLESRLGYKLVMGGCRHFGYWEKDTYWPFPLRKALRAMEEKLFDGLRLPAGSRVLDSGCGDGIVALEMHRRGRFEVVGIDVVPRHLSNARGRISRAERLMQVPEGRIQVRLADFHEPFPELEPGSFDGVYACETLAHAADVPLVLGNYHALLRPGGRISMIDYEHAPTPAGGMTDAERRLKDAYDQVIELGAMPANWENEEGAIERQLREAGFRSVEVQDFSDNVVPLLRLFFALAIIPYFFIRLLRLEKHFVNTTAGVWGYRGRKYWRYKIWSAEKPSTPAASDGGGDVNA